MGGGANVRGGKPLKRTRQRSVVSHTTEGTFATNAHFLARQQAPGVLLNVYPRMGQRANGSA